MRMNATRSQCLHLFKRGAPVRMIADAGEFGIGKAGFVMAFSAGECGREIAVQRLQPGPGKGTVARDLHLRMPDCEATDKLTIAPDLLHDPPWP